MTLGLFHRFDSLGGDGQLKKLGLMGGTFDPIHLGHLRIAEEVREAMNLDGVIFIPTGNPVFKKDIAVTDAHDRLDQVAKSISHNPHFDVSPLEVYRGGDTYTIDTLKELKKIISPNVELYFILGDDTAASLKKWRDIDKIVSMVRFIVAYGRPGSPSLESLKEEFQSIENIKASFIKVTSIDIASREVRRKRDNHESIRYLVPADIMKELDKSLFKREGSSEALTKEFFDNRVAELEARVKEKRFEHSCNVSKTCVKLAKEYGCDKSKARLAGILHDWDKGLDLEGIRQRLRDFDLEDHIDPFVFEHMPRVLHGTTAAYALGKEFPEIPGDVLQAIDRHTTAAEKMSDLDMILYIADAIEPGRTFECLPSLRKLVGKVSLEELYFSVYEQWVRLLFERGKAFHPDTITIWNYYNMHQKF